MATVLVVADAATAAEARVAKLDDGLATGGRLNDAANKGVDDNDEDVVAGCNDLRYLGETSFFGLFSNALQI